MQTSKMYMNKESKYNLTTLAYKMLSWWRSKVEGQFLNIEIEDIHPFCLSQKQSKININGQGHILFLIHHFISSLSFVTFLFIAFLFIISPLILFIIHFLFIILFFIVSKPTGASSGLTLSLHSVSQLTILFSGVGCQICKLSLCQSEKCF